MPAEEQARSLRGPEQVNSVATAARTSILGGYTAGQGYAADADYSPRAWLIYKTGVTRGAAVAYTAWVRRSQAHPRVAEALAAGEISESVARTWCRWTGKLPRERRADADKILAGAAVCGLGLADLAGLFAGIYQRYRVGEPDADKDESFEDPSNSCRAGSHRARSTPAGLLAVASPTATEFISPYGSWSSPTGRSNRGRAGMQSMIMVESGRGLRQRARAPGNDQRCHGSEIAATTAGGSVPVRTG